MVWVIRAERERFQKTLKELSESLPPCDRFEFLETASVLITETDERLQEEYDELNEENRDLENENSRLAERIEELELAKKGL